MSAPANNSPYTTDVRYESQFGVLQAPLHMKIAAGLRGWRSPDPCQPFEFLDVGCGDGQTITLLAAAYPHARFIGFDINSEHLAIARRRAEDSGLENVELVEGDVLDLQHKIRGNFDFASTVGTYAWLDDDRKSSVRRFLAARAKPGALILIDYAALPGSAASDVLYELLRRKSEAVPGNSLERLYAASMDLAELAKSGATFFEHHPTARSRLDNLVGQNLANEAHEVFNLSRGLWFADVARDMKAEGLSWGNTGRLTHVYPEFVLQPSLMSADRDVAGEAFQLDLDVALNTAYRADIFVAAGPKRTSLAEALSNVRVMDISGAATRRLEALVQKATWLDRKAMFSAVGALTEESVTVGELHDHLRACGYQATPVIGRLIAASILRPTLSPPKTPTMASGQWRLPIKYNRDVIEQDVAALHPRVLASPVAGTGVNLPLVDRLTLLAMTGGDVAKAYASIQAAGLSTRAAFGDGVVGFERTLARLVDQFSKGAAGRLVSMGVLDRV